jgi:uncharacterized membrane protein (Fun14 family)
MMKGRNVVLLLVGVTIIAVLALAWAGNAP